MTLEIDSDMNITVEPPEAQPMVFTPDVEIYDIEAPTIVDDF